MEDKDLVEDYKAEDPSILTDEEVIRIGALYGLSPEASKKLSQSMIRNRKQVDDAETQPS